MNSPAHRIDRRAFLRLGTLAATATALGCTSTSRPPLTSTTTSTVPSLPAGAITPGSPEIAARELQRAVRGSGVVERSLTAQRASIDLGERTVDTWTYDGVLPGPVLRASVGDTMVVNVDNQLAAETTVHWHGLALRNDMDGVHHVTERAIAPGTSFPYRFIVDSPGTYWYHSHVGLQNDRGLYGPLIVDDPGDLGRYDVDHVVVLDDWIDGIGPPPDDVFDLLHGPNGPTESKWIGAFRSPDLGGDAGNIRYPLHLLNGRSPRNRTTLAAPSNGTVRMRVVNAAAETAYRFAVADQTLVVTHSDGYAVEPVAADVLLIGPGERYDVTIEVRSGSWPVVAVPVGKPGRAEAVLRTRDVLARRESAPAVGSTPAALRGRLLTYAQLRADPSVRLDFVRPDSRHDVLLTGGPSGYHWGIRADDGTGEMMTVRAGERTRLTIVNGTTVWHPVHLHGHTFRLGSRHDSPRKDTVIIKPGQRFAFDVLCDNPGQWMLHCHNAYHFQAGMSLGFGYVR